MPWIDTDVLGWIETQVMRLSGAGSPTEQIVASIVLGVALIATSSIGLVFTILLLPIPIVAGMIGILRLVPAIDAVYPL